MNRLFILEINNQIFQALNTIFQATVHMLQLCYDEPSLMNQIVTEKQEIKENKTILFLLVVKFQKRYQVENDELH